MSNPAAPSDLNRLACTAGCTSIAVTSNGQWAYTQGKSPGSSSQFGVQVVNVSNPSAMRFQDLVFTTEEGAETTDLALDNSRNLLFVSERSYDIINPVGFIAAFSIANPQHPIQVGTTTPSADQQPCIIRVLSSNKLAVLECGQLQDYEFYNPDLVLYDSSNPASILQLDKEMTYGGDFFA